MKGNSYRFSCLNGSEEEVKLCEGGGETAGEKREASTSATRAQGEEGSGTCCFPFSFSNNKIYLLNDDCHLVTLRY